MGILGPILTRKYFEKTKLLRTLRASSAVAKPHHEEIEVVIHI
jgi:hypothetical protein